MPSASVKLHWRKGVDWGLCFVVRGEASGREMVVCDREAGRLRPIKSHAEFHLPTLVPLPHPTLSLGVPIVQKALDSSVRCCYGVSLSFLSLSIYYPIQG